MISTPLWFCACALAVLTGSLVVVLSRRPMRSALGLLLAVLGVASLYFGLGADLLGVVELVVYAGAVVVLFGFVIMLVGPQPATGPPRSRARLGRILGAVFGLGAVAVGGWMVLGARGPVVRLGPLDSSRGSVISLGSTLFGRGLVPFELSTALLVVAVLGALAVAHARARPGPGSAHSDPTRRLFAGPLVPRGPAVPSHPKDDLP